MLYLVVPAVRRARGGGGTSRFPHSPSTGPLARTGRFAAGAEHPAQTIVGITGLAVPGCVIEIECTAVVDEGEH